MSARPKDFEFERWFWSKVLIQSGDACWLWMGTRHKEGYGMLRIPGNRSYRRAPRVAYSLVFGDIPEGLIVRHTCDNPPCVKPSHLIVGTIQDNTDDKVRRGRQLKGESIPSAVLTPSQVLEIRTLYRTGKYTQQDLAFIYGVTQTPIYLILRRETWKHL